MLQAMRENTRIILWITVIFFVLLIFLVWGADLQFGSGPQAGAIGSVNGESIPVATYQSVLAQRRQAASAQGRDLQPSDVLLIEEQTWNSIVDEMLLRQEAKRRGLAVRDSELRAVLLNDPPQVLRQDPAFLDENGQFDINRYRQILLDPNVSEAALVQIESFAREVLPLEKLQRTIQSAARVTDEEIRRNFIEQNETVTVTYAVVDARALPDEAQPTDEELAAYLEANAGKYSLPRRADLRYVTVPRQASSEDTVALRVELEEFAEEARSAARAEAEGTEDLTHSDFAALAMTFSDGPNADEGGLSAGFLTPSELSPPMRNALEGLKTGEISPPFRDGAFYHIVQLVEERTDPDSVRAVRIRDLARRIAPSDSTIGAVREQFDAIRTQALASDLTAAAAAAGLPVQQVNGVTETGVVAGLGAIPGIAGWALNHDVGTVSRVFETNTGWFLVEIAAEEAPGVPPLEEIRDRVRADLLRDRRFEHARELADRVTGRVKLGSTLEEAAAEDSIAIQQSAPFTRASGIVGVGRDPDVVGAAFALGVGEVSEPLRSTRGWVVLRVDEQGGFDQETFEAQKDQIRANLLALKQAQIYNAWMEELRREADVEDYRL